MRTTVLIPLHGSAPWRSSLLEQLRALRGVAHVVVSDATGLDSTLDALRRELAIDEDATESITWLGPRPLAPGWAAHATDLLRHATTEFTMWLAHDDGIGPGWIIEAERQLDRSPTAVAACGAIRAIQQDSLGRGWPVLVPQFAAEPDTGRRLTAAVESLLSGRTGDLGVLFRSVVRRAAAPEVPAGLVDDEWADVLWALRLLRGGPVVTLEAAYDKRWHDASAHARWHDHSSDPARLREAVVLALVDGPGPIHLEVAGAVWAREVDELRRALDHEHALAHDAVRAEVERSRSWRITAPLRALADLARRRRRP